MGADAGTASDRDLIAAFLRGDERAFETLYFRYRKPLYGYLNNMMPGNAAEADEVFAECWERVLEKLPLYRDDGKFSAWLFRVARNIFLDRLRSRKPERFCSTDVEDAPELPGEKTLSPDRSVGASDIGRLIAGALERLAPEQREVFLLREQELSFKEIADIQHCSLNTVLSRMRYALKNLREFLSSIDQGGLIR